jgi:hypothetical protein
MAGSRCASGSCSSSRYTSSERTWIMPPLCLRASAASPRCVARLMSVPAGLNGCWAIERSERRVRMIDQFQGLGICIDKRNLTWFTTMYRVFGRMAASTAARSICQPAAAESGSVVVGQPACSGDSAVDW